MPMDLKKWLGDSLSKEQLRVFDGTTKHKCIFASAGSGKTRTLVHLIIQDLVQGVPPNKIVAFTFTEKAAREILNRVHSIAVKSFPDLQIEGISIGTIHSWCYQFLLTKSAYYNFSILDELQTKALITRLYDYLVLSKAYNKTFPKGVDEFIDDLEILLNENLSTSDLPKNLLGPVNKFFGLLKNNRLFTFGTVIQEAISHLSDHKVLDLDRIYVDEYQDVNPAQVNLISRMVAASTKLTVIGDDLQCIYNWRGSDVHRIVNFERDFKDSKIFALSTNYRSRPEIIELGNRISDSIIVKAKGKVMRPDKKDAANALSWYSASSLDEEIVLIEMLIRAFMASGVDPNRIAILLRSVRSSGREIYDHLVSAGIPVECPIFSDAEQFIVGFLIPLFEWLEMPGVEVRTEEEEESIQRRSDTLFKNATKWSAIKLVEDDFWAQIEEWKDLLSKNSNEAYNIRQRLYLFLNRIGVVVSRTSNDLMVGLGIGSQIIRSVEEVHRRRLSEQPRRLSISLIKEARIALRENYEDFGESIPIEIQGSGVLITTVHQAKGLEWPVVIIPRLSGKKFPVRNSSHASSFDSSITDRYGTTIEDEKRLFYVACTRAQEKLILVDESKDNPSNRSIFLRDFVQDASVPYSTKIKRNSKFEVNAPSDSKDQDTLRIGLSDVLVYMECPLQYGLRNQVGVQPPIQDNLGYGKGLHEIIQRRFDSNADWSEQEITENVAKNVSLPYTSAHQESVSQVAIGKMLKGLQAKGVFRAEVISEEKVEVYFPEGVIEGVIDCVEVVGDSFVLRDWKANIHDEFLDRYKRQLTFYKYALGRKGRKVSRVEIVDIKKTADSSKVEAVEISESQERIDSFIHDVRKALLGIKANVFEPTKEIKACQSCDMRLICGETLIK